MEDNRVSETQLEVLIEFAEEDLKEKPRAVKHARLMAYLELKQLRAELSACKKQLEKMTSSNDARARAINGHSYCGMHGFYRGDAEVDPCPSCALETCQRTIEARDNECRDEHYTALCECQAELAELNSDLEYSRRKQDEHEAELARLKEENTSLTDSLKAWIGNATQFKSNGMNLAAALKSAKEELETSRAMRKELARLRLERDDLLERYELLESAHHKSRNRIAELRERGEALAKALGRTYSIIKHNHVEFPGPLRQVRLALDRWRNAKPTEGKG